MPADGYGAVLFELSEPAASRVLRNPKRATETLDSAGPDDFVFRLGETADPDISDLSVDLSDATSATRKVASVAGGHKTSAGRVLGNIANVGVSVGSGAAIGASVGSIVPGIGTAIGGAVGAVGGLVAGLVSVFHGGDDPVADKLRAAAQKNPRQYAGDLAIYLHDAAHYGALKREHELPSEKWDRKTQDGDIDGWLRRTHVQHGARLKDQYGGRTLGERAVLGFAAATDSEGDVQTALDGLAARGMLPQPATFRQLVKGMSGAQVAGISGAFVAGPDQVLATYNAMLDERADAALTRRATLARLLEAQWKKGGPAVARLFEAMASAYSPDDIAALHQALDKGQDVGPTLRAVDARARAARDRQMCGAMNRYIVGWVASHQLGPPPFVPVPETPLDQPEHQAAVAPPPAPPSAPQHPIEALLSDQAPDDQTTGDPGDAFAPMDPGGWGDDGTPTFKALTDGIQPDDLEALHAAFEQGTVPDDYRAILERALERSRRAREGRFLTEIRRIGCSPGQPCVIRPERLAGFSPLFQSYTPDQVHRLQVALLSGEDPCPTWREIETEACESRRAQMLGGMRAYYGQWRTSGAPNPAALAIAAAETDTGDFLSTIEGAASSLGGGGGGLGGLASQAQKLLGGGGGGSGGGPSIPGLGSLGGLASQAQKLLGSGGGGSGGGPSIPGLGSLGGLLGGGGGGSGGSAPKLIPWPDHLAKLGAEVHRGLSAIGLGQLAAAPPGQFMALLPAAIRIGANEPITAWWDQLTKQQGLDPAAVASLLSQVGAFQKSGAATAAIPEIVQAYRTIAKAKTDGVAAQREGLFKQILRAAQTKYGQAFDVTKLAVDPFAVLMHGVPRAQIAALRAALASGGDALGAFSAAERAMREEHVGLLTSYFQRYLSSLATEAAQRAAGSGAGTTQGLETGAPLIHVAATVDPGVVHRVEGMLCGWSCVYGMSGCSPAYGHSDVDGVVNRRTTQCMAAFQCWMNSRGGSLRTDGLLDPASITALNTWWEGGGHELAAAKAGTCPKGLPTSGPIGDTGDTGDPFDRFGGWGAADPPWAQMTDGFGPGEWALLRPAFAGGNVLAAYGQILDRRLAAIRADREHRFSADLQRVGWVPGQPVPQASVPVFGNILGNYNYTPAEVVQFNTRLLGGADPYATFNDLETRSYARRRQQLLAAMGRYYQSWRISRQPFPGDPGWHGPQGAFRWQGPQAGLDWRGRPGWQGFGAQGRFGAALGGAQGLGGGRTFSTLGGPGRGGEGGGHWHGETGDLASWLGAGLTWGLQGAAQQVMGLLAQGAVPTAVFPALSALLGATSGLPASGPTLQLQTLLQQTMGAIQGAGGGAPAVVQGLAPALQALQNALGGQGGNPSVAIVQGAIGTVLGQIAQGNAAPAALQGLLGALQGAQQAQGVPAVLHASGALQGMLQQALGAQQGAQGGAPALLGALQGSLPALLAQAASGIPGLPFGTTQGPEAGDAAGPPTVGQRPRPIYHLALPPMSARAAASWVKLVPARPPPRVLAEIGGWRGRARDTAGVDAVLGEYVQLPEEEIEQIARKLVGDPRRAYELAACNPDRDPRNPRLKIPPDWFGYVQYAAPAPEDWQVEEDETGAPRKTKAKKKRSAKRHSAKKPAHHPQAGSGSGSGSGGSGGGDGGGDGGGGSGDGGGGSGDGGGGDTTVYTDASPDTDTDTSPDDDTGAPVLFSFTPSTQRSAGVGRIQMTLGAWCQAHPSGLPFPNYGQDDSHYDGLIGARTTGTMRAFQTWWNTQGSRVVPTVPTDGALDALSRQALDHWALRNVDGYSPNTTGDPEGEGEAPLFTLGDAPGSASQPAPRPTLTDRIVKVFEGETVRGIVRKLGAAARNWKAEIAAVNPHLGTDLQGVIHDVQAGHLLNIPNVWPVSDHAIPAPGKPHGHKPSPVPVEVGPAPFAPHGDANPVPPAPPSLPAVTDLTGVARPVIPPVPPAAMTAAKASLAGPLAGLGLLVGGPIGLLVGAAVGAAISGPTAAPPPHTLTQGTVP
jgi:hypothetical protein